jgi:uncharacterized membrane protein
MYEIFAALAGGKVDSWLAAILYNSFGAVIPAFVYFLSRTKGKTTISGIIFAALAGIAILLFSLLLARIFNKGGNLSYVIPLIYGGAIIISSLFGWLFLKDKISVLQGAGLCLIAIGVACVVMAKLKP